MRNKSLGHSRGNGQSSYKDDRTETDKTSPEGSLDVGSNVFKMCKQPFNLAISLLDTF